MALRVDWTQLVSISFLMHFLPGLESCDEGLTAWFGHADGFFIHMSNLSAGIAGRASCGSSENGVQGSKASYTMIALPQSKCSQRRKLHHSCHTLGYTRPHQIERRGTLRKGMNTRRGHLYTRATTPG